MLVFNTIAFSMTMELQTTLFVAKKKETTVQWEKSIFIIHFRTVSIFRGSIVKLGTEILQKSPIIF